MEAANEDIARKWLAAFNHHDLEMLLSLYDDNAMHYSPNLKIRRPETHGFIQGKESLRIWWKDAFDRLPSLQYKVTSLTANSSRVFMEYTRVVKGEDDLLVGEVLEVSGGLIVASRVYHS